MNSQLIKETRIYLGKSQKDLATEVGVTRQTINLIETGNYNPSLRICKGISRVLNKDLETLFGDSENKIEEEKTC